MKRILIIITQLIILLLVSALVYLNVARYCAPSVENEIENTNSVIRQLHFLEKELKFKDLGNRMQDIFPEGFVFINVLYGLAWAEVAKRESNSSSLYYHGLEEARYAYNQINAETTRLNFPSNLNPAYGIFYCGWKNQLLAKMVNARLQPDATELLEFKINCDAIASAFKTSESPFLQSYENAAWPADAVVAISSLKIYDQAIENRYDTLIHVWMEKVKSRTDSKNGLIAHSADAKTGLSIENARGSSLALMLIFLADIDHEFALAQFSLLKERFKITYVGLPSIREYLEGEEGNGDIDSGPVILDIGFAATIVSMGTFKKFGDYTTANKIAANLESFGFPISSRTEKKYVLGKMPMADAFIAWSKMQTPNPQLTVDQTRNERSLGYPWFFHALSVCAILLMLWLFSVINTKMAI